MKIACIGGGPAGLYLGILVKRIAPEHEVVIYERNGPAETFGFGVVFSDATLGNLATADPETHGEITSRFARWDDIEIHVGGEVLRSTGHGFCGIERKGLLQILQRRAAELGVRVVFEHEVRSVGDVQADIVVACHGVASPVRDQLADKLQPQIDVRPNRFVWLGSTVPYDAFTFLFKHTPHGLFRVHAYRYAEASSTFIVECRDETWRSFGFDTADEDRTIAVLGEVFASELGGHPLIKNRSIWRSFPTVRCKRWHADNVVLVGDAAHTAHFSIGSGTKLAMEDVIVLRDEILGTRDVSAALAAYEARRRPEVEALQAAAQASLEWFEGTERYLAMSPLQFTYNLMTRSLRVSHASMVKRDRQLAEGVERELSAAAGVERVRPILLPFTLRDRRVANRLVAVTDAATVRAASTLGRSTREGVLPIAMLGPDDAAGAHDAIMIDAGDGMPETLPARIEQLRARTAGWLGVVVHDRPAARAAVIGHVAQIVRAGADLIWIKSPGDGNARLSGAPLADRIRNELGVATMIDGDNARGADLDAAIAAGRADLVAVAAVPPDLS